MIRPCAVQLRDAFVWRAPDRFPQPTQPRRERLRASVPGWRRHSIKTRYTRRYNTDVPLKIQLAHVVIYAVNPALQQSEGTFRLVRVNVAASVFLLAMVDCLMRQEHLAHGPIQSEVIGHDARAAVDHFVHCGLQRVRRHIGNYSAVDAAITFYRCKDGSL